MSQDFRPPVSSPTFPPPDHPILAELVHNSRTGGRGPRWALLGASLLFGTAVVLAAVWLVPRELQQWRIAAAEERRLNGDLQGAIENLEQEIKQNPRDLELRRSHARWLMEAKDYRKALEELDQILTWQPSDLSTQMLRAQVHQHLGEHAKAVEDWKRILTIDQVNATTFRAQALNGLAYARSLANIEIDEGLADIDEALRRTGEHYAMLDTRGFLSFRRGDFERALKDLNHAVEFAEAEYQEYAAGKYPSANRRLKVMIDKQQAQSLAVIRYHRALIHDARNEKELAEIDRRRVRELGFEPNADLF